MSRLLASAVMVFMHQVAWSQSASFDTTTAQVEMVGRVIATANAHAKKLGVGNEVVAYCQIELSNKTNQLPRDGLAPFGVNYNDIKTEAKLKQVIEAREAYEKTYLRLCLSQAKRDLEVK